MVKLSFHGAAETVTGSKYLLETSDTRVLFDCGLFQGLKELRDRNWQPLPFDVASVKAVVVTHAHIDHIGYLPRLVKDGFGGPIYCTPATAQLAELMLLDSAHNQQDDADYANSKGYSKHAPALPLYDASHVKKTMQRFRTVPRREWFRAGGQIFTRFHDTGHLLGSSMIECEVREPNKTTRILFSGDVGRYDAPLYYDPQTPPTCDYLVCESTYGGRNHPPENVLDELAGIVNEAVKRGGVILVASFAVGRAQQLIYLLQILIEQNRIPEIPVFLDSPMAVSGMNIFQHFAAEHDLCEALQLDSHYRFDAHNVKLARTAGESRQINSMHKPCVIISSSGMMEGGRILHHLKQRLPNPNNTVVLGGFMAEGTRGRLLADGAKFLKLHGENVPVRAHVAPMSALSGHAGHDELMRWLAPLATPKQVFITHGEIEGAKALAADLTAKRGWKCVIPKMGEGFTLE
jgi:metallo-beta-lactamase family protein